MKQFTKHVAAFLTLAILVSNTFAAYAGIEYFYYDNWYEYTDKRVVVPPEDQMNIAPPEWKYHCLYHNGESQIVRVVKEPTYDEWGITEYRCSRCNQTFQRYTPALQIDLETNKDYGRVDFKIVNATSVSHVFSGASITMVSASGKTYTCTTNEIGKASKILPVGRYLVTVKYPGYNPRTININVKPGINDLPPIGISTGNLVDARFTCNLMTIDEIKQAGIDITSSENQHVYNYQIKFDFIPDDYNMNFYFDASGNYVGFNGEYKGNNSDDYEIIYHPGNGSSGGSSDNGPHTTGGIGGNSPHVEIYNPTTGTSKNIYPINEHLYMIIDGACVWLKEMFHVEMLVINNSFTDTIENCQASIELPDGLSLADMVDEVGEQTLEQTVSFIDKGQNYSFHWYVKGDKEGEYDITGKLSGKLMPFEDEFNYTYSLESPIKVYAGTAMHMTVYAPAAAYYGEDYNVRIEIENVSDRPIYGFTHTYKGLTQYRSTLYSDGKVIKEELNKASENKVDYIEIFNPKDKLVIDVSAEVFFESEIVKNEFEGLNIYLDEIKALLDRITLHNTNSAYIKEADTYFNTLFADLERKITGETDSDKKTAYESIFTASKTLYAVFSESDEKAIDIICKLKLGDFYDDLKRYATKPSTLSKASASRINEIANGFTEISKKDFMMDTKVIDEIKAAFDALPLRFILNNVSVITLSGSTTEIPYSIEILPDESEHYQKITHIDNYIQSLIDKYIGVPDAPHTSRRFSGHVYSPQEIKFVEKTTFSVVSAGGKTNTKIWVEYFDSAEINNDFVLSCDAEDSDFKEGILTFTGSGYVTVTAPEGSIGILRIETTDGEETGITDYKLESVKEHECSGDKLTTVIPSDLVSDGYKTRHCDICNSIIGVETFREAYLGDVDNNKKIEIDDAVMIFGYDAGITELNAKQIEAADTNDDGIVSAEDAILLLMNDSETNSNYTPTEDISRAVFVAVLYRMEGEPETVNSTNFQDVNQEDWYSKAISWAYQNGIVNGITDTSFDPDGKISRQQMAALMCRYSKFKNYELSNTGNFNFTDANEISEYAKEAVAWVASEGLMIGYGDGKFGPHDMATKEHTAIVLARMMNVLK